VGFVTIVENTLKEVGMKFKWLFGLSVALALIAVTAGTGWTQVYTGSISGRVNDQTGAVLPGVAVTLSSERLLKPQTATTSDTGAYRFTELPVGMYTLTFELPGFQKFVREGIIVNSGANTLVNAQLAISQVAETVTVSGESPVVDVRQTGIPERFDNARLENIPSARDPWVIIEQTPGMVMDRQNVGGNESGQQSIFVNRGTNFSQNTWNYDGVNITDNAATGATPMYFDFGAFDEINIQTGGMDPAQQTPGTSINFVIKQGTNTLKGQAAFYGIDQSLQASNVTAEQRAQGAGAGAPIKYILDYGFDVGGPIIRDKAWIWGDYGVQDIHRGVVGFLKPGCTDANDVNCLNDDPTKLTNANVKFNLQASTNNKFSFLFAWNDKTRATRGASDLRPLETTWKQSGPVYIYKFEDTHVVNSNLLFTGRFAYVDGGFRLDYQEPSLRNVQPTYELTTGAYGRSYLDYSTVRPQYTGNLDGNYFVSNALGGDHEFKFGYQYKKTPIDSFTTYGGDVWAILNGGQAAEAWFFRPSAISYEGTYHALHLQDIYTKGRATLKLGLRYDYSVGQNNPTQIPANMAIPNLMPAIDFPGTPAVEAWQTVSPRLGFTYDVTGDGKTIVRASYGRYYDLLGLYEQLAFYNAAGVSEMDLPWTDLNGDLRVQGNEVDASYILFVRNFDPARPGSVSSPNVRDPDLSPPNTDELIVGMEREVVPDLSFGVNYIYKRFGNMFWNDWVSDGGLLGNDYPFVGVPASAFVPRTETCTTGACAGRSFTYYQLAPGFAKTGNLLTNWPDYHQRYQGIEITAHKRLSRRYMFNVGFTYSDHREYFDSQAAIYDPTNIDLRDGGQVYYASAGSGRSGFFMNSRWNFKFDGMVQLPAGINLAGKFNGRQGFAFPETFRSANRAGGLSRVEVLLNPIGDVRLKNLWVADFRVEKSFSWGPRRLSAMMDIFNVFNEPTVLGQERRQNFATANRIQDILSARVVRFGVRFNF
jgi:hypothetical protein